MNRTSLVAPKIRPTHLNRGLIDKLPSDEDKVILTKLLNDCYAYSADAVIIILTMHSTHCSDRIVFICFYNVGDDIP